jgi:hypothetical protein
MYEALYGNVCDTGLNPLELFEGLAAYTVGTE